MNMADQERQSFLRGAPVVGPFEQVASRLEQQGYFAKLSKIPRAWQCTLFRDGAKSETPPTGRGDTALEALQTAAAKLGPSAFF